MVVGCKKDLIDQNKAQYLIINTKVLKKLKEIDPENHVQYTEAGLNANRQLKVNQEDLKFFT